VRCDGGRRNGWQIAESAAFRRLVHFCYQRRGLRILSHAVRRRMYRDRCLRIDDFDGDLVFHCRLDEHMGSYIYWRGCYSRDALRVFTGLLRDGMVFVDVGANQGEFTLAAAKRLPHGRVLAFEPMAGIFERLLRNLEANAFRNVSARRQGLWSEPGRRPLYSRPSAFGDGSAHEGLATLFPNSLRSAPAGEIECTTLDAAVDAEGLERVDLVKIDVEGAELGVLRGARATLERHRPVLLIEADRERAEAAGTGLEALRSHLEERYRIEVIEPGGRTRPLGSAPLGDHQDLLCLPR